MDPLADAEKDFLIRFSEQQHSVYRKFRNHTTSTDEVSNALLVLLAETERHVDTI